MRLFHKHVPIVVLLAVVACRAANDDGGGDLTDDGGEGGAQDGGTGGDDSGTGGTLIAGRGGRGGDASGGTADGSAGGIGAGGGGGGGGNAGGSMQAGQGGRATTGGIGGSMGPRGARSPVAQFLEVRGSDTNDPKAVILTIDDGPDGSRNTDKMLDTLKAEGVKATFCINTENAWFVPGVADAQGVVARMLAEGHELCNHSVSHKDLTTLSQNDADMQMAGVEKTLLEFLPHALPLTLNRAPFMAVNANVQKVLMAYGVHVQVDISSQDFACGNAACVLNNVMSAINQGQSGFILVHGFSGASAAALPDIIKQIKAKGMVFKTTEDVVRAKYGKTSAQLYGLP